MSIDSRTRSTAFLEAEHGRRFCLLHEPSAGASGAKPVLYVHPFAEEMNKSRRMASLQSLLLAAPVSPNAFGEHASMFVCNGDRAVAISSVPSRCFKRGVLVVVGGPQYRAGSHRQFTKRCADWRRQVERVTAQWVRSW